MGHGKRPNSQGVGQYLGLGPGRFLRPIDDGDSVGPTSLEWGSTFRGCRSGPVGGLPTKLELLPPAAAAAAAASAAATVKCFQWKVYSREGPEWT
ncbi:hypothetical protein ACJRO7_011768 [Eucalyptus globulus]|uniref:Uncharacterized protein n=1 Tax=Eucalyptus globulus TaxID=34317 RepID=A0ABD3LLX2_EUCGL